MFLCLRVKLEDPSDRDVATFLSGLALMIAHDGWEDLNASVSRLLGDNGEDVGSIWLEEENEVQD